MTDEPNRPASGPDRRRGSRGPTRERGRGLWTALSVLRHIAVARAYTDELEDKVRAVVPAGDVRLFSTEIRGDNAAVELKLAPQQERSMASSALADLVRREVDGRVPGGVLEVEAQQGLWMLNRLFSSGGGGEALELELRGWELDQADRVAAEMRRRMEALPASPTSA